MSLAWWKCLAGLWNMVFFRELYNSCYSLMFRILKSGSSSTCFVLCLHVKKLNPKMGQFKWEFRLWSLHILTKLYNTWDLPMGRGSFSYVWTKMGGAVETSHDGRDVFSIKFSWGQLKVTPGSADAEQSSEWESKVFSCPMKSNNSKIWDENKHIWEMLAQIWYTHCYWRQFQSSWLGNLLKAYINSCCQYNTRSLSSEFTWLTSVVEDRVAEGA